MLNAKDVRELRMNGEAPMDILTEVVQSGMEYPDALWLVTRVLNLDAESVAELEADYAECV